MLLSVIIGLFAFCAFLWKRSWRRKAEGGREPPEYPGALPLIGHGHLFASGNSVYLWSLMKNISTWSLSRSGVAGFRIGFQQFYMVADLDDCMTVANTALEKGLIYDFMKPVIGEGLLTARVHKWQTHRKLLTPAFNQVVLDGFMGVFNSQAKLLVSLLDQEGGKKPFDGWNYIGPNAFETVCLTAMGGAQVDDDLRKDYMSGVEKGINVIMQRFQTFWLHSDFTFYRSSLGRKLTEVVNIVQEVSNSVLQMRKKDILSEKSKGPRFKAFIDLIIECSGAAGLLTDQEIREEVDTIIVAGHDTSASTTMYALILLGSYPAVQERVLREIKEVLGDNDVEKQYLPRLVYLDAVIKETLRLYPIGPLVARELTENIKLKDYTLPAGAGVYLSLYALQRLKVWGHDADQFIPERWLDKSRIPDHHAAFSAFSIGKRSCIGKSYALMGMKTTLAHLIRNFRFKSDVSKLQLKLDIMLKPHSGHLHLSGEKTVDLNGRYQVYIRCMLEGILTWTYSNPIKMLSMLRTLLL